MNFLRKLLQLWKPAGNLELQQLRKEIKQNVTQLLSLEKSMQEKLQAGASVSDIQKANNSMQDSIIHILASEKGPEKLHLRRLLKLAISKEGKHIVPHLQFVYRELEGVEDPFLNLKINLDKEKKLLNGRIGTVEGKVKEKLHGLLSQEKETLQEIQTHLQRIDNELTEKLLLDYYGHESHYKCPKCGRHVVQVQKIQVRERPRMHQHTFYCAFCEHMEKATDENFAQLEKKWT